MKFFILPLLILLSAGLYAQGDERAEDSLLKIVNKKANPDSLIAKAYLQLISDVKDSLYIKKAEPFFETLPLSHLKLNFGIAKMQYAERRDRPVELITLCNENIKMAEALKDTLAIGRLLSTKAYAFLNYGNAKKGIELQKKAILYFDKKDTSRANRANHYFLAGFFIFNGGETEAERETSLGYFVHAYNLIRDFPVGEEMYDKTEYSGWISNALSMRKNYKQALVYRRKAINYIHQNGDDPFVLGDSYRYLASVHSNMGNHDSSLVYDKKAFDVFLKMEEPTRSCLLAAAIAGTYVKLDQPKQAKEALDNVLYNPKFIGQQAYSEFILKNAARVYELNGDYKTAGMFYAKYIRYNDSITKVNEQNTVAELDLKAELENAQLKYEFEQDKKEEIFVQEQQRQAVVRNFLIAGAGLFLLLVFVLYRSNNSKKKDNVLLQHQKSEIEFQKKEIQDSINYARNIQNALLPNESLIKRSFPDYFILYKPKDVISGDFYWFYKADDTKATHPLFIAAADCTGHGVPGAFMSMLGADSLDNSIQEKQFYKVDEALKAVNQKIKGTLGQSEDGTSIRDGMDIALCAFKPDFSELHYAGAHRPLYLIRNGELIEHKATKQSIGGLTDNEQEFKKHHISLQKGDMVYMTSDGYADQFGGEKGKKFTTSRFKTLLRSISGNSCEEQKQLLDQTMNDWRSNAEQLDDILIIGIRV